MWEGFARGGVAGLLLGALAVVACGGGGGSTGTDDAGTGDSGGGGDFCESFTACGGNVVGTWRGDRACAAPTRLEGPQICDGETYDLTRVVTDLAWTFRADGTVSVALTTTGSVTIAFPTPCNQGGSIRIACADIGETFASRIAFVGGKAMGGACHEAGGTCTCPVTFTAVPQTADGTYSTSGATLQYTLAGLAGTTQYCASATTMKMRGALFGGPDTSIAVYSRQ